MNSHENFELLKLRKVTIKNYIIEPAFITSVELYESITQPGITGYITISDFQGLQELGNVFADDDITLVFGIDGDESNELTLKYKIFTNNGSKYLPNNTYDVLRLGFCSEWMIDGLTKYVSKPFGTVDTEIKISDIVKKLLEECGAKIGYIEPTKQKLENFVTPLWTPYHSIKYLLSFATNENNNGGYVCWTDLKEDKVNVTSLDYLLKGTLGKYETFIVNPANLKYSGRVFNMSIENAYDSIRMVNIGLPKTDFYAFNYDNKSYLKTDKAMSDLTQTRLAKKFPLPAKFEDQKYRSFNLSPLFPPTSETKNTNDRMMDFVEGQLSNKYSMLTTDAIKINIETNGETKRRAGWLALLEFPSQAAKTGTGNDNSDNKQMKGVYLIREIKHVFSLHQDYRQFITLVSDGFQDFSTEMVKM